MNFTNPVTILVVMLIVVGLILGGLSLSFASVGDMMGSGMMGNGGMMGSGMMGNGGMMGSGMSKSNIITNMTSGTKVSPGITVSIVSGAGIMGDKAFQPNPVTIKVGDNVTWINEDTGLNDPNEGRQFNSGLLSEGQTVTHTFKTAGEINYFCQIHPNMIGKIIVE